MAKLNDDGSLDFGTDDWNYEQPKPQARTTQPDPNSPEEIARINGIYGPGGTAFKKPNADSVWDPQTETWSAGTTPTQGFKPGGGSINDPAYLSQLVAYYGTQPGSNPSVSRDPNYWIGAAPRFGGDEAEFIRRMMSPEGPPEGGTASAGGGAASAPGGGGSDLSSFLMQLLMRGNGNSTDPARTALLGRMNALMDQYSQPVTADDPTIKASTQAYTGQVGRSLNAFKKQAAERAYAEGVPTGAFDSQIGNAQMAGGRAIGDNENQMMRDEMLSRRSNLMSTMQGAGSLLSAQDAADIQNKIANIDAVMKSRGLDIESDLGGKSLDLQKLLGLGGLSNQSTSINNQNNQFYDKLGADEADTGSSLDTILQGLLVGRS